MTSRSGSKSRASSVAQRTAPVREAKSSSNSNSTKRSAGTTEPNKSTSVKRQRPQRRTPTTSKDKETSSSPTNQKPTAATTFGIEFEFVLAFNEDRLAPILHDVGAQIVKDGAHSMQSRLLNYELKKKTRAFENRALWPSWLLKVPKGDEAVEQDAVRDTFETHSDGQYTRRYVMEPLLVARQALTDVSLHDVQVVGWNDKSHTRDHCSTCEHQSDGQQSDLPMEHYTVNFRDYSNDIRLRSMVFDYEKWTLTNDYTLVPVRRADLEARLVERSLGEERVSWDSYGLELISRVMLFKELDSSFVEIEAHLSALKAKRHVDLLESVWASTHVHIGFNAKTKTDLEHRFFQHVAFILLCYETLVTQCFPRRCSGAPEPSNARPNTKIDVGNNTLEEPLDTLQGDGEAVPLTEEEEADLIAAEEAATQEADDRVVKKLEEDYTGNDNVRSNHAWMQRCLGKKLNKSSDQVMWHDIRDAIFTEYDEMVQLMRCMQMPQESGDEIVDGQRHRGYMVNWCNLYTIWTGDHGFKSFKPTLEFRQHPCTISADVIRHWTLLLQAIMALAQRMVLQDTKYGSSEPLDRARPFAEQEASKYPNDGFPLGTVKAYVVQLLGLKESEGLYWEGRYETYKNDRPM